MVINLDMALVQARDQEQAITKAEESIHVKLGWCEVTDVEWTADAKVEQVPEDQILRLIGAPVLFECDA